MLTTAAKESSTCPGPCYGLVDRAMCESVRITVSERGTPSHPDTLETRHLPKLDDLEFKAGMTSPSQLGYDHDYILPLIEYMCGDKIWLLLVKTKTACVNYSRGVAELFEEILVDVHVTLGLSPLAADLAHQSTGLANGGLLVCGPKGVGKSALCRAVCKLLTELPSLVHITVVDCKPLRGK